ncbi:MAG: M61 family metallopeptidase [Cyanophyceae cyanobacterium]
MSPSIAESSIAIAPELQVDSATPAENPAQFSYRVVFPAPHTHFIEVELAIAAWDDAVLDLVFPVWTPGSYLVREYSRHVQDFSVAVEGKALPWRKQSKNRWQVDCKAMPSGQTLTVKYRVFANDLTVRTNHVDATHAYFNGACTFFYVERDGDRLEQPYDITVVLPEGWASSTTLPKIAGDETTQTYRADDFDWVVDSPFEIGTHDVIPFEAGGKRHQLTIWGQGNHNVDKLVEGLQKIVEFEKGLFGGLPYDRYTFMLALTEKSYGGLEHKDNCCLIFPRYGFRGGDDLDRFWQLCAHEFFHLWNVKRLRPKALEIFDYDQENYTPSLWFCEGVTSYYDPLIPLWAGIYNRKTYLHHMGMEMTRYLYTPGRKVQPLAESSYDAWIKLYRQEAHSGNNQISYYVKGAMVTLLLDLRIRMNSGGDRSFDNVLRRLWEDFGKDEIGYTPEELQSVLNDVAGEDLSELLHRYLYTTERLPLAETLAEFGIELKNNAESQPPYLGIRPKVMGGRVAAKFVELDSPAYNAGIDPNDEILALNGLRIMPGKLLDRLRDYQPGDAITLTCFKSDQLVEFTITLGDRQPTKYTLVPIKEPTPAQKERLEQWLGKE